MHELTRPIIALTMGDPAGVGPEIALEAALSSETHSCCRPLIIGSADILRRAAQALGKQVSLHPIREAGQAEFRLGVPDVLETGDYDAAAIEWGKVDKLAGEMCLAWIYKSIALGLNGEVDAVVTAPINKSAIKLAGEKEAGHTEIYQRETNSPYSLTMFSCHKLRVFFVSRHLSLADACRYITKERIVECLVNIDRELRSVGLKEPSIAVAALNPHGGDSGLFGREEIEQLAPAVEAARALGINASGPHPADSVFYIGRSGKYDAILSLYHDQGHIACKTLDFEKSVTLTFGLPFIRGSVDHGTAFDIAGKGVVNSASMIEAVRIVAEYAGIAKQQGV